MGPSLSVRRYVRSDAGLEPGPAEMSDLCCEQRGPSQDLHRGYHDLEWKFLARWGTESVQKTGFRAAAGLRLPSTSLGPTAGVQSPTKLCTRRGFEASQNPKVLHVLNSRTEITGCPPKQSVWPEE